MVPKMLTSAQPWQSKDWVLVTTGNWPTSYMVIVLTMPSGGMQEVLVEAVYVHGWSVPPWARATLCLHF